MTNQKASKNQAVVDKVVSKLFKNIRFNMHIIQLCIQQ